MLRAPIAAALVLLAGSSLLPAEDPTPEPFAAEIRAFETRDRESPPPRGAVVFVGSSSIRLWDLKASFPGLDAVNRGFGGSHISHCIRYLDRIVLPLAPRTIVFYAGDNDVTAGKTPEAVFQDFVELSRRVHEALPETEILYLAIKPSASRWDFVGAMRRTNDLVRDFIAKDERARLRYVDTHTPMLGADGKPDPAYFADDRLHLSARGYDVWNTVLRPWIGPASVLRLDIPGPRGADDSAGGIVAADLTGDGAAEILVTCRGHVAAYEVSRKRLWVKQVDVVVGGQSESEGLPGHHGPGVSAGDVDGDGRAEVVFLTRDGILHAVDGASGDEEAAAKPPVPAGAERWELALVADFRGKGADRDILLQATDSSGYRMGRHLAAWAFEELVRGGSPLWTTGDFVSCAHNGARLADLDGDGKDEVLGVTVLGADGKLLVRAAEFEGHIDSVFSADVRPEIPGLEVVLLEEGSNHVQLLGIGGPIWRSHLRQQEPQNAALGRFKPGSDDLFIWCRSRYDEHQKPFVFDSLGEVAAEYAMDDVAPRGWTTRGVEVIHTIDWTGGPAQLACAKERHERGDVAIFEPLTGRFVRLFRDEADRLYVADVLGDWREEVIVLRGNELRIYENPGPNPRPDHARLWRDRNYRRAKQAHNYYSP